MSFLCQVRNDNTTTQTNIINTRPFGFSKILLTAIIFITIHITNDISCSMCITTCSTIFIITVLISLNLIISRSYINRILHRCEIIPSCIICIRLYHTAIFRFHSLFGYYSRFSFIHIGNTNSQT